MSFVLAEVGHVKEGEVGATCSRQGELRNMEGKPQRLRPLGSHTQWKGEQKEKQKDWEKIK